MPSHGEGLVRDQTLEAFLDQLAARTPAPGGGATAALHGAQAAALIGMVARYSGGERAGEHADDVDAIRAEADAAAFTAVIEAYRMPKVTSEEKASRTEAIAAALAGAADPAVQTIDAATAVLDLAERLLPVSNPTVRTDIAIAAESARAAATSSRVNVEVNLGGIRDQTRAAELHAGLKSVPRIQARADQITETVRAELAT